MNFWEADMVAMFDIEVFDEWGEGVWAQEPYFVHGFEDVLWTDDLDVALDFIRESVLSAQNEGKAQK